MNDSFTMKLYSHPASFNKGECVPFMDIYLNTPVLLKVIDAVFLHTDKGAFVPEGMKLHSPDH